MAKKKKKESKDWYIATTHYLTAGFAVPFIINLVLGLIVINVFESEGLSFAILVSLIWLLGISLGVIYSSRYVNKTYIIKNKDKIAKISTVLVLIINGTYKYYDYVLSRDITTEVIIHIITFVVGVSLFYILSKKYIKNTSSPEPQE